MFVIFRAPCSQRADVTESIVSNDESLVSGPDTGGEMLPDTQAIRKHLLSLCQLCLPLRPFLCRDLAATLAQYLLLETVRSSRDWESRAWTPRIEVWPAAPQLYSDSAFFASIRRF